MDGDELKSTFHRVAAYRQVCEAVRRSANHTLLSGVFFLIIAGLFSQVMPITHPVVLIVGFLALAEIGVGIWKKLKPSVECVLMDSIINLLFGISVLARQVLVWQGMIVGSINPLSIFVGCWALYDSWNNWNAYRMLRRAFVERPTAEQMDYVRKMSREIQFGDPERDPQIVHFESIPPIRAMLVPGFAFVVDPGSGDAFVIEQAELIVERRRNGDGEPLGLLTFQDLQAPPFALDDASWRNYVRWKGGPEGLDS